MKIVGAWFAELSDEARRRVSMLYGTIAELTKQLANLRTGVYALEATIEPWGYERAEDEARTGHEIAAWITRVRAQFKHELETLQDRENAANRRIGELAQVVRAEPEWAAELTRTGGQYVDTVKVIEQVLRRQMARTP